MVPDQAERDLYCILWIKNTNVINGNGPEHTQDVNTGFDDLRALKYNAFVSIKLLLNNGPEL